MNKFIYNFTTGLEIIAKGLFIYVLDKTEIQILKTEVCSEVLKFLFHGLNSQFKRILNIK